MTRREDEPFTDTLTAAKAAGAIFRDKLARDLEVLLEAPDAD